MFMKMLFIIVKNIKGNLNIENVKPWQIHMMGYYFVLKNNINLVT